MAVVESKLRKGSLTLGTAPGVEYACQATNVRIVPTFNEEGDNVETLCGDTLAPSTTTTWALQGTHIQDWDAAGGVSIIQYSWEHNLETVPFTWKPNETTTSITGEVQVRALDLGGDVNKRITSDFDWPISGEPTATFVAMATAGAGSSTSSTSGSSSSGSTS